MIDTLLRWFAKSCLALRYRLRTEGLPAVAAAGTRGILFLPNHPALIDPIIVGAVLHKTFRARFLADKDQVDRFFIRSVARKVRVIPIPDPAKLGSAARDLGAISGGLHTRWAALAKLGLVLGAGGGVEEARQAFARAWAGEPR